MDDRTELSEFLKSRRARLRPGDVGLHDGGGLRRVAGLRREELARLAGVSIAHYTRLEQGKGDSISDEVLDAIGAALRLDTDELAYLHRIARRPLPCAGAATSSGARSLHAKVRDARAIPRALALPDLDRSTPPHLSSRSSSRRPADPPATPALSRTKSLVRWPAGHPDGITAADWSE